MGKIQLSVQELFAMPENSYQLVDIRDERARSYGVIPGSVALSAEELPESQEIDKNKTVVIYCQKGECSGSGSTAGSRRGCKKSEWWILSLVDGSHETERRSQKGRRDSGVCGN